MNREAWRSTVHEVTESDTTEQLSTHKTHTDTDTDTDTHTHTHTVALIIREIIES